MIMFFRQKLVPVRGLVITATKVPTKLKPVTMITRGLNPDSRYDGHRCRPRTEGFKRSVIPSFLGLQSSGSAMVRVQRQNKVI